MLLTVLGLRLCRLAAPLAATAAPPTPASTTFAFLLRTVAGQTLLDRRLLCAWRTLRLLLLP
ncbi:MAG: hypothetical protein ACREU7_16275, partial [Burkholderiales bacterium]